MRTVAGGPLESAATRFAALRDRADAPTRAPLVAIVAVFLSSYLSWRPSLDIMFTTSDVFFLLSAGTLMVRGRIPAEPFHGLTPYWLLGFVTMMTGLLVASLFDGDPVRWLIVAGQYGFAWVVLPFILMGHGRDYTVTLIKTLVIGIVVMEIIGTIVYFTYQGSFEDAKALFGLDFLTGNKRLGAFATDANWNGAATAMALPFVFYLASKRLIQPIPAACAIVALLGGLLLSASFTAFVSAAFAAIVFVVISAVRPRFKSILIVAALAMIAVQSGYGLPAIFQKRVAGAIESGDLSQGGTYEGRVALIAEAWDMVEHHMLVGVGVDQYRVVSRLGAPVHNMFLLVWAEGGLVALFGWLTMLTILIVAALMAFPRDRLAAALAVAVVTTFVTFSTASPHMYARLWAVPVLLATAVAVRAAGEAYVRPAGRNPGRP